MVAEQIRNVRAHIPAGVTLVCVSKYHPVELIREAYDAGERDFGESRVQELKNKIPQLPADIRWHFIGHLQTNKVRDLLKLHPFLIHSVDSERLLRAINDEAAKLGMIQDVLLEVHVAKETTKSGFSPEELQALIPSIKNGKLSHIRVRGLMTMATNTDDEAEIRRCFSLTAALLSTLHSRLSTPDSPLSTLSMGMSDDFPVAIECGSTMVRIGSSIFGERTYPPLPKAVFFDQDGVLYNSMPFHAEAWERAMRENGLPFSAQDAYRNEGRTGASVIAEAFTQSELPQDTDVEQLCNTIYSAKSNYFNLLTGGRLPDLIQGIREVLLFLHSHGVQCWVVTGSGQRTLIDSLRNTFPDIFTGIITSYDVTHGKPDPEPYLKAWERSGFKKEECMVVENAPLGVRAGKAAGLFTAAVNTGPLPDSLLWEEKADIVLPDMKELLKWLQNHR